MGGQKSGFIEADPTEPHCLTWRRRRNKIMRQSSHGDHISGVTLEHIELYQDYYKDLEKKHQAKLLSSVEKDQLNAYYKALADIYKLKAGVCGADIYSPDDQVFSSFLQNFPVTRTF